MCEKLALAPAEKRPSHFDNLNLNPITALPKKSTKRCYSCMLDEAENDPFSGRVVGNSYLIALCQSCPSYGRNRCWLLAHDHGTWFRDP